MSNTKITQTNRISFKSKNKFSITKCKTISHAKIQAKVESIISARKKSMFEFTNNQKSIGDFTKNFYDYYSCNHETFQPLTFIEFDMIFKNFPEKFQKTSYPDFFNFTHWIGIHINHNVNEFDEKSNSELMIFHKDHPETMHSVSINIWLNPKSYDYWFRIEYKPNRIYLTDYDGFKVYDFQLNLLFFKSVLELNPYDMFGFEVDKEKWNEVRIWSMDQAREITNTNKDVQRDYNDIKGLESIAELVVT